MPVVDYYFSTISPYTYLAGPRFRAVAEKYGAEVRFKPFDIMSLFPRSGGLPLGERHPARQAYRLRDLARSSTMAELPLNVQPPHFPTNAAPSSYAIIAAQEAGGGDMFALVEGILAACWAEEKNIAEDDVIRGCLEAAGFDPALAEKGLWTAAPIYTRNLEEAAAAGVFGAPSWIVDGELFWGQDRVEQLDRFLAGEL